MRSSIKIPGLLCLLLLMMTGTSFAQLDYGKGIEIYDCFVNGTIDRAVIWFTVNLDSLTVEDASPAEFTVEGHMVSQIKVNQDNNGDGFPDGLNALTVQFHESDDYNTGFTPQVTYSGASILYNNGVPVQTINQFSAIIHNNIK